MKKILLIFLTTFFISTSWGQDTIVKKDTTVNIQVRANSRTPGDGMDIVIRGRDVIVDGIPVIELRINSVDIDTMYVEKDNSPCSLPENRGYNNVIIVKTKRGNYRKNDTIISIYEYLKLHLKKDGTLVNNITDIKDAYILENEKPLIVIDGVAIGNGIDYYLNPNKIVCVAVNKEIQSCSPPGAINSKDVILITTRGDGYWENINYPDYIKGSYDDFTNQIKQKLQANAQKIGFTGSIDVHCSLDIKGALRVDNIPPNIEYTFKQLLIQAIESDDEWTPATYDGKPIEMSFLFEFEF